MPSLWRLKTRILPSTDPVAQRSPCPLNATACTRSWWPCLMIASNLGWSSTTGGSFKKTLAFDILVYKMGSLSGLEGLFGLLAHADVGIPPPTGRTPVAQAPCSG